MGMKARPYYRVIAAHDLTSRDGRFIDQLGTYDPITEPATIKIDKEKALKWLREGAQPSDTVIRLLKIDGVWSEWQSSRPVAKPRKKPAKARGKPPKPLKIKKKKETPKEDATMPNGQHAEDTISVEEPHTESES
jgi:small subunit ribosomal protein S16